MGVHTLRLLGCRVSMQSLHCGQTLRHILSLLAHPGSIVLPNSPPLQRVAKNSHKLNRESRGGFAWPLPPLLGRETKKYSLREQADAPAGPCDGL